MKSKAIILFLAFSFMVSCHKQDAKQGLAFRLIGVKQPEIAWIWEKLLTVDLNDDGNTDVAIPGIKGNNKVVVAAVISPIQESSNVQILEFSVGRACQNCVCTLPVEMIAESMDYDPKEVLDGTLSGFVQSNTAQGLEVVDTECDMIHIFWNHKTNDLDWWRL
jgi:hypothetical protein